ncbi:hypothetical protein AB0C34_15605 [Nocardia sp. NPDC049220]|uniref:hypothetical protein n=1 Tax=Nocardia sp. NPDC049220 TaxID=3155273 RepID=UPI0033C49852
MTADDKPWEIPPLDDAPDIARVAEQQPGQTLADAKNWPGYGLLLVAAVVAVAAAAIAGWGFAHAATVAALIAAVALLTGGSLVVVERLRSRARARKEAGEQIAPAWQTIVPPQG